MQVLTVQPGARNVGLVVGSERAVLVDAGHDPAQGRRLAARVREVTDRPLAAVVLTHGHAGHAGGRAGLAGVPAIAHESVAAGGPAAEDAGAPAGRQPAVGTGTVDRPIAVATAVDLGGRRVEIVHLGRGHTGGDLLVVVPDAGVVFAGDLIDATGGPWFGPDSFPHEWPATLDGLIGLLTATGRAVPGHGAEVDREFVFEARGRVAAVSGEITRLAGLGVPADQAAARGDWALPVERLAGGLAAGYAQLGR